MKDLKYIKYDFKLIEIILFAFIKQSKFFTFNSDQNSPVLLFTTTISI